MSGTLFVVATPIGNLEDITARALRVLREVSLIAAEDTRRTSHLLARYAIPTPTTSLHEHNESRKVSALLDRLRQGQSIALVSDAGTPTVSDPGRRLIQEAAAAGLRVEPIPGPSAALAALSVSGFAADTFTFLGFPPTRSKDRKAWFEKLAAVSGTVVFFEAPHRIRTTLEQLLAAVGDSQVAVGREMTKAHEELVRGPISSVIEALSDPKGEFTVVLEIGRIPDNEPAEAPGDAEIASMFGCMTITKGLTRRMAVSALARKLGIPAGDVYRAIERSKKLVE